MEIRGVWPELIAPQRFENPHPAWEDPALPDLRTIWKAAREVGYAVAVHGSLKRDFDLIAAPWTDEAEPPASLISALCAALNARQIGEIEEKPHGRIAVILCPDGWFKHIDLSIMPRT